MNFKCRNTKRFETGLTHFLGQHVNSENIPVTLNWETRAYPTFDSPYLVGFDKKFTVELNGENCVKLCNYQTYHQYTALMKKLKRFGPYEGRRHQPCFSFIFNIKMVKNFRHIQRNVALLLSNHYLRSNIKVCFSSKFLGLSTGVTFILFVCVGVLRPSQQRGHVEPVS